MGKAIARTGKDYVGLTGGKLSTPRPTNVYANNKMISIRGQFVTPHFPCGIPGGEVHCVAFIVTSSSNIYVNNKGVVRIKDTASCGDKIITGSGNVYA